ncbi:MAG: hypothetical protein AABX93_00850 [Nanoarchaeota archaeon]
MTDGCCEVARDQERGEGMNEFYVALTNYLENSSHENQSAMNAIAKATDEVRGGYFGGQTNISGKLERKLQELKNGNRTSWARTLLEVHENRYEFGIYDNNIYERLKKMSPYNGKIILLVDYGCNGRKSNIDETTEFSKEIDKRIESAGMRIHDGDNYIVSVDEKKLAEFLGESAVDWVHCGINSFRGPRKPNED